MHGLRTPQHDAARGRRSVRVGLAGQPAIRHALHVNRDPLHRARSFGWWSLLVWLTLGLGLEALHGFKVGWYLDVANETRRLMFTLAHTHGTLLSLVHLAFAATLPADAPHLALAGRLLRAAAVLMPLGFLLGGVLNREGDPSLGIALVPLGGAFVFVALVRTALAAGR